MAKRTEVNVTAPPVNSLNASPTKFVRDVLTIVEMKLFFLKRTWLWYLLGSLVFPVSLFYWSRALAPDDPEAIRRLMTGSMVFGVSVMTANSLSDQIVQDRFQGRLKLLITMPMSKASYAIGVTIFVFIQSTFIIALLMGFSIVAGVDSDPTLAIVPVLLTFLLTMAGLVLTLSSFAPSAEVGGIINGMVGIVPIMISPVFFTMEQAPLVIQWLGYISPVRYAADGITKAMSGQSDVWVEFAVLLGFAVVTIATGFWKMRWREQ